MPFLQALIFVALIVAINPGLAEVYRWKDENGNTVFGDTPPPKNKTATEINIDNTKKSGTQFASPSQVDSFKRDASSHSQQNIPGTQNKIDSHCRDYISQLNKVNIYLEHTKTQRDLQKSRDLQKLIKKECSNDVLTQKFDDYRCKRYREELTKKEIYLKHTVTQRDQQKINDLRQQIARECQ